MKNNCYIYWDDDTVPAKDRKVYIKCQDCFDKDKKGMFWSKYLLYGKHEIKCDLCNTIIYKRLKKKKKPKGEDEATI